MERHWYLYEAGKRVGPVTEEEMKGRAGAGVLRPEVLVWREGMKEWKAAGEATDWVFGVAPEGYVPPADAGAGVVAAANPIPHSEVPAAGVLGYVQKSEEMLILSPRVLDLMAGMGGWLRFFGVMGFVFSGMCLLASVVMMTMGSVGRGSAVPTGVGVAYIVMGVLYLFPAGYLNKSASAVKRLKRLHRTVDLEEALEGQKAFWGVTPLCGDQAAFFECQYGSHRPLY